MSKCMTPEELCSHCKDASEGLGIALREFSESPVDKIRKRAMLIGYWLKTYVRYIKNEDEFSPRSVYRLKRGSVVQVEFGYRIGRELGGRHYAVVIDADNAMYRNTVTVIPLGSMKDGYVEDEYSAKLDDGVYGTVIGKLDALLAEAKRNVEEATAMDAEIKDANNANREAIKAVQRQRISDARKLLESCKIKVAEISRLKQGSIAKVDQIVTISKMRISAPLQKTHPLYGVKLTDKDMDKIDKYMNALYLRREKE